MINVKKLIAGMMTAAMVFTNAGVTSYAATAVYAAEAVVATVTTDETMAPIEYSSFDDAISKTNVKPNKGKHPVIDVAADVENVKEAYISIPMTINLNGHTLENYKNLKVADGSALCVSYNASDWDGEAIVFASHTTDDYTTVYSWSYDGTASDGSKWTFVGYDEICDNLGVVHYKAGNATESGNVKTYTINNVPWTVTYANGTYTLAKASETVDSKKETAPTEPYSIITSTDPHIVAVNGINQHNNDGTPVMVAPLRDNATGATVDAVIEITKATDEEIAKARSKKDGIKETDKNTEATCTSYGTIIYKVVVSDPEGNVLKTTYRADDQAIAKTDHKQGALAGYQVLTYTDYEDEDGSWPGKSYPSEAQALAAGGDEVVAVYSRTSTKDGSTRYYFSYWSETRIDNAKNGDVDTTFAASGYTLDNKGTFTYKPVYYCDYENDNTIEGDPIEVEPYANATKASEAADGKHSTCTKWVYPETELEYTFTKGGAETTYKFTGTIGEYGLYNKAKSAFSHVSNGTSKEKTTATCIEPGVETFTCSICGSESAERETDTLDHVYDQYLGDEADLTAKAILGDAWERGDERVATLSSDKLTATLAATCEYDGGTYAYCTGNPTGANDTPHWVIQGDPVPATGHDFAATVTGGTWYRVVRKWQHGMWNEERKEKLSSTADVDKIYGIELEDDEIVDYVFETAVTCKNDGCEYAKKGMDVKYHSMEAPSNAKEGNVYDAVTIVDEEKGADCVTVPYTTFTVDGLTYTNGNAVEFKQAKYGSAAAVPEKYVGPHNYKVDSWNWSKDYETATVTVTCKNDGCNTANANKGYHGTFEATVTKSTASNGVTTFTAAYENVTDTKTAYTLKGAEVSYNTSAISDANLVKGVYIDSGYTTAKVDTDNDFNYSKDHAYAAPAAPAVVVTLNGTVLDDGVYTPSWAYESGTGTATEVQPTVALAVEETDDCKKVAGYTSAKGTATNCKHGSLFAAADLPEYALVYENGKAYDTEDGVVGEYYDADTSYSVEYNAPKGSTVKYAVVDEEVEARNSELKADAYALQKKIEALDFDLSAVENIKDAGTYFVYAQVSKNGYTTYTSPAPVAVIYIAPREICLLMDNITVAEGETPEIKMRAVHPETGKTLNIDLTQFTVTTAGGAALNNLEPGTYKLIATAPDYMEYEWSYYLDKDYLAILTVVAKDGSTAEDRAAANAVIKAINALNDDSTEAEVAAVRAAYNALTDVQKGRVTADDLAKLAAAEDKVNQAAAAAVVSTLSTITDTTDAATAGAAVTAFNNLTQTQKDIVKKDAVAYANLQLASKISGVAIIDGDTPAEKKASKITVKLSSAKIKRGKTKKITVTKTGNGKVTFTNKSSKAVKKVIKVTKAGVIKVTKKAKKGKTYKVKVVANIAATSTYKNAKSAVKTIKVKVK